MGWQFRVRRLELSSADERILDGILRQYFGDQAQVELASFVDEAAIAAAELPEHLRRAFYAFKTNQEHHALCIALDSLDDAGLGRTPARHKAAGQRELISRYDALDLMFASLLGEPFAWTTIQNAYVFNDVIPVSDHRELPASSGFANTFGLHTEDAFQQRAGDYLGLLCLRNPGRTPTIFSGFLPEDLDPVTLSILFEPRFVVGANVAHDVAEVRHLSPILFGNQAQPYLRINLNATTAAEGDEAAARALKMLVSILERNAAFVAFQPGEFWYIDNLHVAHGRAPYDPTFDGSDRWLRRLYITSAFRYSVAQRSSPGERLLDSTRPLYDVVIR